MVRLRDLTRDDALAIRHTYSDASVRYLMRPEMTAKEAERYVAQVQEWAGGDPVVQYILGVDVSGDLVGVVKLRRAEGGHGRVSYVLRADTWGRGYATAAVRELIRSAFTTADFESLGAKHHPGNAASGRVLLKAGFARVGATDFRVDGNTVAYPTYELHRP